MYHSDQKSNNLKDILKCVLYDQVRTTVVLLTGKKPPAPLLANTHCIAAF